MATVTAEVVVVAVAVVAVVVVVVLVVVVVVDVAVAVNAPIRHALEGDRFSVEEVVKAIRDDGDLCCWEER